MDRGFDPFLIPQWYKMTLQMQWGYYLLTKGPLAFGNEKQLTVFVESSFLLFIR